MNKGGIFIISGPSGSGKDTLLVELFKKCPDIKFSISSITRPMREGEVEGEKYNFISREKFEQMLKDDMLLEHNVYAGNYYGTPKFPVIDASQQGFDMMIEDERMQIALSEIARADEYDYIVVNDDITTAVDDLISVISNSRLLLNRQKFLINEVLNNA